MHAARSQHHQTLASPTHLKRVIVTDRKKMEIQMAVHEMQGLCPAARCPVNAAERHERERSSPNNVNAVVADMHPVEEKVGGHLNSS